MLKIRLQRVGRAHEPAFRLVLTDSKNATKSGKVMEILGNYDARRGEKSEFKTDRVTYWMSKGAQATPTVHNLLISKNVITGKKINTLPLKKAIVKDVPAESVSKDEVVDVTEAKTTTEEVGEHAEGESTLGEATTAETPAAEAPVEEVPATETAPETVDTPVA